MRKDQCKFCNSRRCHYRIVSCNDNGKIYDEVACSKHTHELDKDSDEKAPGVMKLFLSVCGGTIKRGDSIASYLEQLEGNYAEGN